jgi:phage/plasmid-like protein (TIGR03299 family)
MGHEITSTDATFSVREMPWMGLLDGQVNVLPEYPTREEAQKLVHPWEPVSEPLYRKVPVITEDGELREEFEAVPTLGNFRSDVLGAKGYLGPISPTLVTVSNNEMWDIAEVLQGGPKSDVLYETGGSLSGGKRVWILLKLAEPIIVAGDPHGASVPYYLLQNNHAGEGAFRGAATQIRVVCKNTIQQADVDAEARGTEFAFSHTKNIHDRIEEAREALAGWRESLDSYRRLAEFMVDLKVTPEGAREYINRFIPEPISTMTSDRVKNNIEVARDQWWDVYNSVTCEGITGTAWGLLQASSEWSEHVRRANSAETRFKRAMMDRNHIMADAKDLALEAAHA